MELFHTWFVIVLLSFQIIAVFADDILVLKQRLDKLENELNELKSTFGKNDQKRLQPSLQVAFSAVLDAHGQNTASHNQPIKYDKIYTNIGNGYDNSSGVFHPPINGLYQLYASVAVDGDDSVHAFLEKNGQTLCACTAVHYSTGSCMVIVPLEEGDIVWAREVFGTHVRAGKLSAFTGLLLKSSN